MDVDLTRYAIYTTWQALVAKNKQVTRLTIRISLCESKMVNECPWIASSTREFTHASQTTLLPMCYKRSSFIGLQDRALLCSSQSQMPDMPALISTWCSPVMLYVHCMHNCVFAIVKLLVRKTKKSSLVLIRTSFPCVTRTMERLELNPILPHKLAIQ